MPVSTGSLGEPRAKRCKLCDESSHRSESGSGFWQLQLDRDLVDTISAIYPDWFQSNMAEGGSSPAHQRESPPKAVIDTSPLHIDQNKESLKVKLMLRRDFDQLVAQGIMPPHKTPAAYHGQRRQLERAKTGDMLKAKIQQRPPRQELERRHILEADPGHVDPSLAERQRMLKKARLADQLNDQLSHRPGPLELIQKNILHTEEPIEQAVKTGRIPYKATSEGQLNRPQHPHSYSTNEDDSQSSEGDNILSPGPSDVLETAAKSAGIVVSLLPTGEGVVVTSSTAPNVLKDNNNSDSVFADLCRSVAAPLLPSATSPASLVSSTSTLSPLSSIASPVPCTVSQPATPVPPPPPPPSIVLTPRPSIPPSPAKSDAPGKDKNRKKSKSKSAPKARTIKFHEYKGPPSAQKTTNNNNPSGESSYDLLLQQQTLLLQFQLQLQHKYPQILLPASQKTSETNNNNVVNNGNSLNNNVSNVCNNPLPSPAPSTSSESSTQPCRPITGRLEDMKVSDLKAELKRRSLPVSGSKPQLIERLKPFTGSDQVVSSSADSVHSNSSMDQSPQQQEAGSPHGSIKEEGELMMEVCEPPSPLPQQLSAADYLMQKQHEAAKTQEDIVREQKRQIEELQRELTLSQLKLQAATTRVVEPKAQLIALQKHLQARQQQQAQQNIAVQMQQLQALQARQAQVNEEQQRLQQQQHVAFQNQKNLTGGLVLNGADATALVFNLMQGNKAKLVNGHNRTNSLPNFLNGIVTTPAPSEPEVTTNVTIKDEFIEDVKPPPHYEEATKQIGKKSSVKSQIVDDVLDILIKNGELPPSAAQDPLTPSSAGTKQAEPVFPVHVDPNSPEAALGLDPSELLDSLDSFDSMDFNQLVMGVDGQQSGDTNNMQMEAGMGVVPMDTDDWLESLCGENGTMSQHDSDLVGYDPLMGVATQDPFDPFNLDEFRSPADLTAALSWDKVDYAA